MPLNPMSTPWLKLATVAKPRVKMLQAVILYSAELATKMALGCDSAYSAATATSTSMLPADLLRDAKLYEIGAGTSEIRRMLIGRELFTESN